MSYETGLFRMARAVDESWEVQIYSCGLIAGAAAIRFGNTTIEVAMPSSSNAGGKPTFVVNGVKVPHGDLPGELPDGSFLGPHHKVTFGRPYAGYGWFSWGSCADDPKGQVRVEISSSFRSDMGNLMNVMIEAAEGSYVDGDDEEKVSTCPGAKWLTAGPIDFSESLFTNPGDVCASCKQVWAYYKDRKYSDSRSTLQNVSLGGTQCEALQLDSAPRADELCDARGVSMDHAKQACDHLSGKPIFFEDCVYDVCATGSDAAADNAEAEEEEEEPEPKCLQQSPDCDPKASCCDDDASRGLNFGNVVQNNLDGSGDGARELRFGQVIDGVDLLITCPDYTSKRGNDANGLEGMFGSLNIDVGKTQNFTFTFVAQGTTNPTSPGNAVVSFLDLDQGKKNKQRESLKICGLSSPIVTSNTELETTFIDSCYTAKSTGRGTNDDNPDDPATMDDVQRARTIAFPLNGKSSFSAELSVSPTGEGGRNFLFSGHPTVACE